MEPAGSGATWTLARRVSIGQCESTRVASSEGVEIISNVNAQRSAVRSIAWLGVWTGNPLRFLTAYGGLEVTRRISLATLNASLHHFNFFDEGPAHPYRIVERRGEQMDGHKGSP
jgi:hypothetical protein